MAPPLDDAARATYVSNIARRLGAEADVTAVLACRDVALGRAAAEELRRGGCDARALPTALDLPDPDSLRT